jgi:hypothetical protein
LDSRRQKVYARALISEIIVNTLSEIDPEYPKLSEEAEKDLSVYRASLVDIN